MFVVVKFILFEEQVSTKTNFSGRQRFSRRVPLLLAHLVSA